MSEQGESLEPIENVIAKKPEIVHEPAYYTFSAPFWKETLMERFPEKSSGGHFIKKAAALNNKFNILEKLSITDPKEKDLFILSLASDYAGRNQGQQEDNRPLVHVVGPYGGFNEPDEDWEPEQTTDEISHFANYLRDEVEQDSNEGRAWTIYESAYRFAELGKEPTEEKINEEIEKGRLWIEEQTKKGFYFAWNDPERQKQEPSTTKTQKRTAKDVIRDIRNLLKKK